MYPSQQKPRELRFRHRHHLKHLLKSQVLEGLHQLLQQEDHQDRLQLPEVCDHHHLWYLQKEEIVGLLLHQGEVHPLHRLEDHQLLLIEDHQLLLVEDLPSHQLEVPRECEDHP